MKKSFFIISFFALLLLPNFASAATSVNSSNSYYQLQSDAIIYNADSNAAYGNIKKGTTIESVSLSGNDITVMMGDKKYYINSSSITKIDTPPTQGYSNTETVAGSIVTNQQAEVFNISNQVIGTIDKNLPISYYGMTDGKYQIVFGGNLAYIPTSEAASSTATQSSTSTTSSTTTSSSTTSTMSTKTATAPSTSTTNSTTTSSSTPTTSTKTTTAPLTSTTSSTTTSSSTPTTSTKTTTAPSTSATSSTTSSSTPTTSTKTTTAPSTSTTSSTTSSSTPTTSTKTTTAPSTSATSSTTSSSTPTTSTKTTTAPSTSTTSSTTSSSTPTTSTKTTTAPSTSTPNTTSTTSATTTPKTMISLPKMMTSAVTAPQVVYTDYFKVTSDNTVVYDSPSSPMNALGTLLNGQSFKIDGQSGNYLKIHFGSSYGYISKNNAAPVSSPSIDNVNSSFSNSSQNFKALQDTTVYDNNSGPFAVIKKNVNYPIVCDYGNWYRILIDNRIGYVKKDDVWVNFTSDEHYFKTVTDNLPVYDNNDIIGYLKAGQTYKRLGGMGNWHQVQFGMRDGYVYNSDTRPSTERRVQDLNTQYSNTTQMFLAKVDTTVYSNQMGAFATIKAGEIHPIAGYYGNWYRVLVAGRVGYVYSKFVDLINFKNSDHYFTATENGTAVYDNRPGHLKISGELIKGQTYHRIKNYGNWHQIKFGDHYGYVYMPFTKLGSNTNIDNPTNGEQNSNATFTATSTLSVYDNSTGDPFGTISKGEKYPIVSRLGNWYEILYGNRIGYVQKQYTSLNITGFFKAEGDAPIYSSTSTSSSKLGTLNKNEVYKSVKDMGSWYQIQFGDQYGYVLKSQTLPDVQSSVSSWSTGNEKTNGTITTTNDTGVYDNSTGQAFGSIPKGTTYPIINSIGSWYEINLAGRIGYLWSGAAARKVSHYSYTSYNYSVNDLLNKEMSLTNPPPQTDQHPYSMNGYMSSNALYISNGVGTVVSDNWHLRTCAGTGSSCTVEHTLGQGETVTILGSTTVSGSIWYKVNYVMNAWIDASASQVAYYIDPSSFSKSSAYYYQFLDLSKSASVTASELNTKILYNQGIFANEGQAFVDAAKINKVNEMYLIAHAMLESGNGQSQLATGVCYNPSTKSVVSNCSSGVKVYDMYGFGAFDSNPLLGGAQTAYAHQWFTPEAAIIGGANLIAQQYIYAGQNTLYKMRWNPDSPGSHQYATDIGWAVKQTYRISQLYDMLNSYSNVYDIPQFTS